MKLMPSFIIVLAVFSLSSPGLPGAGGDQEDSDPNIIRYKDIPEEIRKPFEQRFMEGLITSAWDEFCREFKLTDKIDKEFFLGMDRVIPQELTPDDMATVYILSPRPIQPTISLDLRTKEGPLIRYLRFYADVKQPLAIVSICKRRKASVRIAESVVPYDYACGWQWPSPRK